MLNTLPGRSSNSRGPKEGRARGSSLVPVRTSRSRRGDRLEENLPGLLGCTLGPGGDLDGRDDTTSVLVHVWPARLYSIKGAMATGVCPAGLGRLCFICTIMDLSPCQGSFLAPVFPRREESLTRETFSHLHVVYSSVRESATTFAVETLRLVRGVTCFACCCLEQF